MRERSRFCGIEQILNRASSQHKQRGWSSKPSRTGYRVLDPQGESDEKQVALLVIKVKAGI